MPGVIQVDEPEFQLDPLPGGASGHAFVLGAPWHPCLQSLAPGPSCALPEQGPLCLCARGVLAQCPVDESRAGSSLPSLCNPGSACA